jgi:hypothetical protein
LFELGNFSDRDSYATVLFYEILAKRRTLLYPDSYAEHVWANFFGNESGLHME